MTTSGRETSPALLFGNQWFRTTRRRADVIGALVCSVIEIGANLAKATPRCSSRRPPSALVPLSHEPSPRQASCLDSGIAVLTIQARTWLDTKDTIQIVRKQTFGELSETRGRFPPLAPLIINDLHESAGRVQETPRVFKSERSPDYCECPGRSPSGCRSISKNAGARQGQHIRAHRHGPGHKADARGDARHGWQAEGLGASLDFIRRLRQR